MYYIVNQNGHIIAADERLLRSLSLESIDDLYKEIALGNIEFTPPLGSDLSITISGETNSYNINQTALSSVLGEMTLVTLEETSEAADDLISYKDDELSIINETSMGYEEEEDEISILDETPDISVAEEEAPISIMDDEKPFDLIENVETPVKHEIEEVIQEEKEEAPVEKQASDTSVTEDDTPIYIDIARISENIGISQEDYNNFLNEYIDTALTLEEDLKSSQEKKRTHAIETLSHLSNVLQLPVITKIVDDIQNSIHDDDSSHIESLYHTLARLTTSSADESTAEEESKEPESEGFGTIDLSDVKPIHFDFQIEEAASELSLPVELIEEFVVDFIDQAHEETKKMLEAYEKGDLETIQKIGHLLKGTSSNLRINPLSDTLYQIQFCEDSSNLEALIKEYWAHFLSFEHQINMTVKK